VFLPVLIYFHAFFCPHSLQAVLQYLWLGCRQPRCSLSFKYKHPNQFTTEYIDTKMSFQSANDTARFASLEAKVAELELVNDELVNDVAVYKEKIGDLETAVKNEKAAVAQHQEIRTLDLKKIEDAKKRFDVMHTGGRQAIYDLVLLERDATNYIESAQDTIAVLTTRAEAAEKCVDQLTKENQLTRQYYHNLIDKNIISTGSHLRQLENIIGAVRVRARRAENALEVAEARIESLERRTFMVRLQDIASTGANIVASGAAAGATIVASGAAAGATIVASGAAAGANIVATGAAAGANIVASGAAVAAVATGAVTTAASIAVATGAVTTAASIAVAAVASADSPVDIFSTQCVEIATTWASVVGVSGAIAGIGAVARRLTGLVRRRSQEEEEDDSEEARSSKRARVSVEPLD